MKLQIENADEFPNFPNALRKLVEDELQAGNEVIEIGHGFPAAPCGAYLRLAHPVTTRKRESTPELDFYDRNSSCYSGEFTDANRHFFVLEPPRPPESPPDMQAIRAAIDAGYPVSRNPLSDSVVERFARSMEINYDKWREGESYDLALLDNANDDERQRIEDLILRRSPFDWRDIQALAKIDSPKARAAMLDAFDHAGTQTRMSIHRYAPALLTETQRTESLVRALRESEIYTGLSQALAEIEDFHPPAIIHELLRGLMRRDGAAAYHFAAMLYVLHGKSSSVWDWENRPFFLKFNNENLREREQAFRELCREIGVDPAVYL
jgi:hypothetical protein